MKYKLLIIIILLFVVGCKKNDNIVIYSSMEEERNQALKIKLKEKFPNLDIIVTHIGTGNSAAKIRNDKDKIEADIILELENSYIEDLKDNFITLDEFDKSNYNEKEIISDKYLPWYKVTCSLIIDNNYFKAHNLKIPKSYEDLLDESYKNLIAMPDPKTSSTGYSVLLNVVNVMGEDKALSYFKELHDNMREFTISGSGPINLLKQGEVAMAFSLTNLGVDAINKGYDYSIITFDTKAPYNLASTGIIKKDKIKDNVKEVFNYLITDYIRYDKEYFVPGVILKNQENKIKNYPNIETGNMEHINDKNMKLHLIDKWDDIYG